MPKGKPIPADIKAAVVAFVRSGATYPIAARRFSLSVGAIAGICHQAGLRGLDEIGRIQLGKALAKSREGRGAKPTLPAVP